MRKFFLTFLLIALSAATSFSRDVKLGILVSSAVRNLGAEGAIGVTASIPIINIITFNPELNFVVRTYSGCGVLNNCEESNETAVFDETAISIPLLIQGMPFGGPWFYMEAGILVGIPLETEISEESIYEESTRQSVDYGIVGGFGWHIFKYITFNFRWVFGSDMVTIRDSGHGHTTETINLSSFGAALGYLF